MSFIAYYCISHPVKHTLIRREHCLSHPRRPLAATMNYHQGTALQFYKAHFVTSLCVLSLNKSLLSTIFRICQYLDNRENRISGIKQSLAVYLNKYQVRTFAIKCS